MPNGTYGGVRGRKTKVGRKLLCFPPTRFNPENLNCFFMVYKCRHIARIYVILCQAGKTCAIRHVVVVIRSLNIFIINKE